MDFVNESWKEIEGYAGRYQVSNYGRIWNTVTCKYMALTKKKTGYLNVCLVKPNKKQVTERVHRLVALAFCEKPNGCNVVNHIDSDKANNYYKNLEWTTISGNTKHCYENNESFRQQVNNNSKKGVERIILTLEVRDKDGFFIGKFKGYKQVSEILGINEKTVRNIVSKRFNSNRSGYEIKIVERGGDAV